MNSRFAHPWTIFDIDIIYKQRLNRKYDKWYDSTYRFHEMSAFFVTESSDKSQTKPGREEQVIST